MSNLNLSTRNADTNVLINGKLLHNVDHKIACKE